MRSFDLVSLFDEPRSSALGVPPFFLSSVAHAAAIVLLSYGLLHGPRIEDPIVTERYSIRHLELHTPDASSPDASSNSNADRTPVDSTARDIPNLQPPVPVQVPVSGSGEQTLLQPNFHTHVAFAKPTPIPTVMIWTPELATTRQIVAPLPDKPTATATKPSTDEPNEELTPVDRGIASAQSPPKPVPLAAGTTSPLSTEAPQLLQMAPATTSISDQQPTPAAVLSLSNVRMINGTIILPPVNEISANKHSPALSQAQPAATSAARDTLAPAGKTANARPAAVSANTPPHSQVASMLGGAEAVQHIVLPKNGRFGVVVVGASVADAYPESLQVWSDRIAYTAYLHVGLARNWILEYAQTRSADAQSSGVVARLEAPWPYDIFRPNLVARDLNADALMVHGIVNESGRFESLGIAFPAQYARAAFVLHALQQWQFRPARQNGKAVPVEILLIIPEEMD